jgi:predicted transcriptional regulator
MARVGRPKLAQVKEVFPVRLPDDRRRALQAEAEMRDSTTSDVIRMHLERYAEITWHDLPKLTDRAWCAVFEALGGVPIDVGTVARIGTSIARLLEETDLPDKWSIDASEIASAARTWTFGQACAVADAMARFRRALAVKGADAIEAARQATTRPAALVLETPASPACSA